MSLIRPAEFDLCRQYKEFILASAQRHKRRRSLPASSPGEPLR